MNGPGIGPGRRVLWSRRRESNPQPIAYKAIALPLSYAGFERRPIVDVGLAAFQAPALAGATQLDLELDLALDAL